jgi:hypothetical protein
MLKKTESFYKRLKFDIAKDKRQNIIHASFFGLVLKINYHKKVKFAFGLNSLKLKIILWKENDQRDKLLAKKRSGHKDYLKKILELLVFKQTPLKTWRKRIQI